MASTVLGENMEKLKKRDVIAILRNVDPLDAPSIAKILLDAGVKWMEVSLSEVEQGLACIRSIRNEVKQSELKLGVGTVSNKIQVDRAIEAGAAFIITPGWDRDLIRYIRSKGIEVFPGVLTPGDVMQAMEEGIEVCKLFPISVMGFDYVNSLLGPFPRMKFIGVGGVNLGNYLTCMDKGFYGAGIGGSLVPRGATCDDLELIKHRAEQIVKLVKEKDEIIDYV